MFNHERRDRKLFIVLEYGELDYAKYLHLNKGKLSSTKIKCQWEEMVNAVAEVHAQGIIHSLVKIYSMALTDVFRAVHFSVFSPVYRDLKPCNFLICRGAIKLIDFGIANTIAPDVTRYSSNY